MSGDRGSGIGDWGIGDRRVVRSPIPDHQSPNPLIPTPANQLEQGEKEIQEI